jgi:uncharacterized protein YdeI (YjbR/CyaY-like superfamily)
VTVGDLPVLSVPSREAWDAWLASEHARSPGVWLRIAKKRAGVEGLTYPEALEVALSYGWIDGQKAGLDDEHWLQRFTPRRPRSRWSKRNREAATRLIERGEMKAAGLREVEAAKADGRWEAAYDGQRSASVPEDLARALAADERARAFFETLDSTNRYAILYRVQDAKRPETRARRIERFVSMLAAHQTIHPQRSSQRRGEKGG